MIKELFIEELNGNKRSFKFKFNDDLNLFTGLNGCGKTTILKILWFVNSANFSSLFQEINFKVLKLTTDKYYIEISKNPKKISWRKIEDRKLREIQKTYPFEIEDLFPEEISGITKKEFEKYCDSSIFFPTFRRIEGGFSIDGISQFRRFSYSLKEGLSELSKELSTKKHQFIASVSTDDITSLINKEYTSIMKDIDDLQRKQFKKLMELTKVKNELTPEEKLKQIESEIKMVEEKRDERFKAFYVLQKLITTVFRKKGIDMDSVKFGDGHNLISSDKLSAGEKQMLSFLCYNTFSKNKIIYIDEPELSLHPDWQRLLIPTLLKQGNNNQFFIATHSPFIYTKYSDKEIMLNPDKGE